jgi:adhesin transport system membrane fusion protein
MNAGKSVLGLLEAIRVRVAPVTDRILDRITGPRVSPATAADAGMRHFELQADAVMSTATTYRAQTLVRTALLIVVLLIVWATFAHVDEVT